jgi:peptidyl-prolyl cis-trans isomerase A (cyclophilin A)
MLTRSLLVFTLASLLCSLNAFAADKTEAVIKTSLGDITIELLEKESPLTVANFKNYVNKGFYSGTIFHRTIPGFMIQGGGFDESFEQKVTDKPVQNESGNGMKNQRGTLAMARTNAPHSATSQFFINVAENDFLNDQPGRPGYAVFAKVVSGMDVVDGIVGTATHNRGMHQNVPVQNIVIESITIGSAVK